MGGGVVVCLVRVMGFFKGQVRETTVVEEVTFVDR